MTHYYEGWHFSPALVSGDLIWCSGIIGIGADSRPSPDPRIQFTWAFERLQLVLSHANASLDDIVEMTSYHIGLLEHMPTFRQVKDQFISAPYPAWSAIGISELALPGALAEIRAVARKPAAE